jgi:phosphoserine phosphatase
MTPDLWFDGLDAQALAAVRRACAAGVPDAEQALADLEARGGRSVVARAIVRRLAGELAERAARNRRLNPELNRARHRHGGVWN